MLTDPQAIKHNVIPHLWLLKRRVKLGTRLLGHCRFLGGHFLALFDLKAVALLSLSLSLSLTHTHTHTWLVTSPRAFLFALGSAIELGEEGLLRPAAAPVGTGFSPRSRLLLCTVTKRAQFIGTSTTVASGLLLTCRCGGLV